MIPTKNSVMESNPMNLSSQPYRKANLSLRGCGHLGAAQDLLPSTLQSKVRQQRRKVNTQPYISLRGYCWHNGSWKAPLASLPSKYLENSATPPISGRHSSKAPNSCDCFCAALKTYEMHMKSSESERMEMHVEKLYRGQSRDKRIKLS